MPKNIVLTYLHFLKGYIFIDGRSGICELCTYICRNVFAFLYQNFFWNTIALREKRFLVAKYPTKSRYLQHTYWYFFLKKYEHDWKLSVLKDSHENKIEKCQLKTILSENRKKLHGFWRSPEHWICKFSKSYLNTSKSNRTSLVV